MRLTLFRRRRIVPADLPPVSGASMPGPLHSGLTGTWADAWTKNLFGIHSPSLAAAVASAEATHPAKTTVEPPDDRVCAYRDPYTGQLACPPCYADDVSVLWTPRTNDDLPRGGLCAFCDVDVLTFLDPEPVPVATDWPTREPRRIEQPLGGLAPLGVAAPLWCPGRYTVTYDRIGEHGRRGSGLTQLPPLTAVALTVGDLAQQIVTDVHQLIGLTVTTMTDQAISGGIILGDGGARLGTFTYERRGGAR